MPEISEETVDLKAQYAGRLATDLEQNFKEQDRITAEIAALQERLDTLRHDQALLASMQDALGTVERSTGSAETGGGARTATPRSRAQRKAVVGRAKTVSRAEAPAPKSTRSPTLGELIREQLAEQVEPRSAAEVAAAFAEKHPERRTKVTVVRATLEGLVAKGHVHRIRQRKSVFYSAAAATAADAAAAPGQAGAGEPADAAPEGAVAENGA